jgi:phosphopantetheinyl transferase (holo-ACP synthase)
VIGNDVIDLALAKKESNWKRKGFLDKIFTPKEQSHILKSQNPETTVWNLWSRKEAAYKIYNRQTQVMAYIPIQLECFDLGQKDGAIYGKVICHGKTYFTKSILNPEYIETIAVTNLSDLDKIKYLNPEEAIFKINGIPNCKNPQNQALQPMSKSHHGRFEKLVTL